MTQFRVSFSNTNFVDTIEKQQLLTHLQTQQDVT